MVPRHLVLAVLAGVSLAACQQDRTPARPAPRAEPRPLEPLLPLAGAGDGGEEEREALYRVQPLAVAGPALPAGATRVTLDGERATVGGQPVEVAALKGPVLLEPGADTWLVQVAPLLAALDDAGAEVWLRHPEAPVAFRVVLRDEPAFQRWLDEPVPGKVRIIQRADGFELQTNLGKLPGGDPNGPTVPVRGGQPDLTTLRRGLQRVRTRFPQAPDACLVPSFGTELQAVARALATDYPDPAAPIFPELCLVYPRPRRDAGR